MLPACPCVCVPRGYLACVSDALDALGEGSTLESAEFLQEALVKDPNGALARAALGYTLLLGGRVEEAVKEFDASSRIDTRCSAAIYGRGLVSLKKGQLGEAASHFCEAQQTKPEKGVRGTIEYVKAMAQAELGLANRESGAEAVGSADEAMAALAALELMRERQHEEAAAIWRELQPKAARPGFGERIGCSMTFVKDSPLAVTGRLLKTFIKPAVEPVKALRTVKGTVRLQADLSRARSVRMVTFMVDDQLIGITNRSPFESAWDTTRWANGRHTVKIIGTDDVGGTVSEKTTQVIVDNPLPEGQVAPPLDDESRAVWDKLWEQIMLKPSAAAINYNLAVCAQETGDLETAKAALERVMAANPAYLDAGARLSKLRGPMAESETIRKVKTSAKTVALTFDDGPKPETADLLDALKQKDVKATFFVVGKQAEKHPDLVKRMSDDGHEIGNHSYDHLALEYLPTREIEQDLFRNAAVVRSITGREMRLLRPPGAHGGKKVDAAARKYGMRTVLYSANCGSVEGTTRDKVVRYAVASAQPGAVILMHNLDRVTLQALPGIVDTLRAKGYGFATVSELARRTAAGGVSDAGPPRSDSEYSPADVRRTRK